MKIKRKELRDMLNHINDQDVYITDDHRCEMEEEMGKKQVKRINKMLKKMGKKLTSTPTIVFMSASGNRYLINAATYEADVAAYQAALDAGDEITMDAFETGSTGWICAPE